MVVFQVEVTDFTLPDVKGQSPLPADRMLHVPSRSPVSWWMRQPGGPITLLMSAAAISTARMLRSRSHKIGAEFLAVAVFDETQQAPVPDAPNDRAGMYPFTVQLSTGTRSVISQRPPLLRAAAKKPRNPRSRKRSAREAKVTM